MTNGWRNAWLCSLVLCAAPPASARVAFTGYGDLRWSLLTRARIAGTPAALKALKAEEGEAHSQSFRADAVGLFATTELREGLDFQMDLSYRDIGAQVGQTRMQYAYLDYSALPNTSLKAGRFMLPLGYYNENRFYPFHRDPVNPPVFTASILGLPISDWGVSASRRFPGESFTPELSFFAVNGYGPVAGTKNHLREPTPLGLSLANSLRASDANHKPAWGGRARLSGGNSEAGFSYYRGEWDSSGTNALQMMSLHARARAAGLDAVVEGLRMEAEGDEGFKDAVGGPDWRTTGFLGSLSYALSGPRGLPLVPFAQMEYYLTRTKDGSGSRELLRSHSAGLALRAASGLVLKAEYIRLFYLLPMESKGGEIHIDADGVTLGLVITF